MASNDLIPPRHFFSGDPVAVHGALAEGMHLAGYTFERACKNLDWLLTDNRWQACGFADINAFLATIDWSDFKIAAEQRKEISRKLAAINASQRQIARTLGVGEKTVRRDLDLDGAANAATREKPSEEIKGLRSRTAAFAAPDRKTQSGAEAQKALAEKDKRPRSGNASHDNDDEWYTPSVLIEPARECMGGIDLDPASSEVAQKVVQAAAFFTAADDGLAHPWRGRVFLNPPYSKAAGKADFIAKLAEHYWAGEVTEAVVVISYDFSAGWFEPLRGAYTAICLMRGRVQFYKLKPGDGHDPALGTSVVYLGGKAPAFSEAFAALGDIVVPYR